MHQRGFAHLLLLLILIVAAAVAAFFLFGLQDKFFPKTASTPSKPSNMINPAVDGRSGGPAVASPAPAGGNSQFNSTIVPNSPSDGQSPDSLQLADPDKWPG